MMRNYKLKKLGVLVVVCQLFSVHLFAQETEQTNPFKVKTILQTNGHTYVKLQNGHLLKMDNNGWQPKEKDINSIKREKSNDNFEIVLNDKSLQFSPAFNGQLIAGYKDESIVCAASKRETPNDTLPSIVIYQSKDQGDTWEELYKTYDGSFGQINRIEQPSANHLVLVVNKFEQDSNGNWKKKYYVKYSADLGKTWTEYDPKSILGIPLHGFYFKGNKGVFTSIEDDNSTFWWSNDYGNSWNQYSLPTNLKYAKPFILDNGYLLINDSIHYLSNVNASPINVTSTHKNFKAFNTIVNSRHNMWSASPISSGVGDIQKSYIVGTTDGGKSWNEAVNVVETEDWSKRGLQHRSFIDSNTMTFLGPNILYVTQDAGSNWEKANWNDSITGGTRGVYLFYNQKEKKHQVVFPVNNHIFRYTVPGLVGLEEEKTVGGLKLEVYPNPSSSVLQIRLNNGDTRTGNIQVLSMDGKLLMEQRNIIINMDNNFELDVSTFQTGIYFIKYFNTEYTYTHRFIKQ